MPSGTVQSVHRALSLLELPAQAVGGCPCPNSPSASALDGHHPPDAAPIGDCVHCGFCIPTCPT